MRWTYDDELRFGLDVADFIDTIRDAEDAPQRIIALIEDQLWLAGVPSPDHASRVALADVLRRLERKDVKRITAQMPASRDFLLGMCLAVKIRALINDEDSRERKTKRRRGKGGR